MQLGGDPPTFVVDGFRELAARRPEAVVVEANGVADGPADLPVDRRVSRMIRPTPPRARARWYSISFRLASPQVDAYWVKIGACTTRLRSVMEPICPGCSNGSRPVVLRTVARLTRTPLLRS
jgi:hypothetical protein